MSMRSLHRCRWRQRWRTRPADLRVGEARSRLVQRLAAARVPAPHPSSIAGANSLPSMVRPDLADADLHLRAVGDLAFQQQLRQRVLQPALDHALQRPRAIDRIVARIAEPVARLVVERDLDLAVGEQACAAARSGYRRSCPCSRG